eukprot:gene15206-17994_t
MDKILIKYTDTTDNTRKNLTNNDYPRIFGNKKLKTDPDDDDEESPYEDLGETPTTPHCSSTNLSPLHVGNNTGAVVPANNNINNNNHQYPQQQNGHPNGNSHSPIQAGAIAPTSSPPGYSMMVSHHNGQALAQPKWAPYTNMETELSPLTPRSAAKYRGWPHTSGGHPTAPQAGGNPMPNGQKPNHFLKGPQATVPMQSSAGGYYPYDSYYLAANAQAGYPSYIYANSPQHVLNHNNNRTHNIHYRHLNNTLRTIRPLCRLKLRQQPKPKLKPKHRPKPKHKHKPMPKPKQRIFNTCNTYTNPHLHYTITMPMSMLSVVITINITVITLVQFLMPVVTLEDTSKPKAKKALSVVIPEVSPPPPKHLRMPAPLNNDLPPKPADTPTLPSPRDFYPDSLVDFPGNTFFPSTSFWSKPSPGVHTPGSIEMTLSFVSGTLPSPSGGKFGFWGEGNQTPLSISSLSGLGNGNGSNDFLSRSDIAPLAQRFGITFKEQTADEASKESARISQQLKAAEADAVQTFVSSINPEKPF